MIDDVTIDYDHVQSSTATVDGSRIVLTLDAGNGPVNISLPLTEVPRLVAAIGTAASMAREALTDRPASLALRTCRIEARVHGDPTEMLLVVELSGGTELAFLTDRRALSQFASECVEAIRSGPRSPRPLVQ